MANEYKQNKGITYVSNVYWNDSFQDMNLLPEDQHTLDSGLNTDGIRWENPRPGIATVPRIRVEAICRRACLGDAFFYFYSHSLTLTLFYRVLVVALEYSLVTLESQDVAYEPRPYTTILHYFNVMYIYKLSSWYCCYYSTLYTLYCIHFNPQIYKSSTLVQYIERLR